MFSLDITEALILGNTIVKSQILLRNIYALAELPT